jgi:sec-independent protein translocase protein TatA
MGGLSLPHLIVLALVVLVLFGRGRISEMMGDFGKGIKSFKHGMNEEVDRPVTAPPPRIAQHPPLASAQQQQAGTMAYDPVTAPPTTDPSPPHPVPAATVPPAPAQAMPFDPVSAPAKDDAGRG